MKEIKLSSNNNINKDNVPIHAIKEGDKLYYRVVNKLGNNKYLVNILGKQITATIDDKVPNSGMVKVLKTNNELVLKIMKKDINDININKSIAGVIDDKAKDILLNSGISANIKNINYLDTVLKYISNLTYNEKSVLLNYISKSNYFSVNELDTLFHKNVYIILLNSGIFSKIPKTKSLYSDNYDTLINSIFNNGNNALAIKNAVDNNGYLGFLLLLLNRLGDDYKEIKEKIKLLINTLVANRRIKSSKNNIYYLQVPINIDNSPKDLKLFIEIQRDDKRKLKMYVSVFDDGKEFCKIEISKDDICYDIFVSIFKKNIYDKYIKNEKYLLKDIESIEKMSNMKINVGVGYEQQIC